MKEEKAVKIQMFNVKPSLKTTKDLAVQLTKFIDDNKLSVNIAGKKYVMVEGWQFAGSQLGLTAIPTDAEDVSKDTEIKYKASAEVFHVATGTLISRGFAICSNKESKKIGFDEYAVASMAQTRAIGKAYRNNLSWLMKLAGFEGTPVEEITDTIKEDMVENLGKIKTDVFNKFKEKGVEDTQIMLDIIQKATGKQTIDNADDAMNVLAELEK
jgi:hypothetical protein